MLSALSLSLSLVSYSFILERRKRVMKSSRDMTKIDACLVLAGLEEAAEHVLKNATVAEVLELYLRIEAKDALERAPIGHLHLDLLHSDE